MPKVDPNNPSRAIHQCTSKEDVLDVIQQMSDLEVDRGYIDAASQVLMTFVMSEQE